MVVLDVQRRWLRMDNVDGVMSTLVMRARVPTSEVRWGR
jgi:hypothetical protein